LIFVCVHFLCYRNHRSLFVLAPARLSTFQDHADPHGAAPHLAARGCVLTATRRLLCALCYHDNRLFTSDIPMHVQHEATCPWRRNAATQQPAVQPRRDAFAAHGIHDVTMRITIRVVSQLRRVQDSDEGHSVLCAG
jgi:hypothetical protein